jgi:D-xylose transport system substrate-binding protein
MSTFQNPRYPNVDLPEFKKAVEAAGFTLISNQADDDPAKQVTNVNSLLSRDLAALALLPVNSESAVSLVRKAVRQGVPVLNYNTPMPSGQVSGFVGRDNVAMGELISKTALKDTGLKGNWAILNGDPGNEVATKTVEGFNNVIKPYVDDGTMKIVGQYDQPGFDNELARKQVQEVLTKVNNDIQGILAMWEGGVIGSLAALRNEKLAGKVWLGGQDATVVSCRAMVLGEANMSGFTEFDVMGKTGGELAVQLAQGKKLQSDRTHDTGDGEVPFFPISIYPVTIDNLVEYLTKYSPSYVDANAVFEGIPESKWPKGAKELLGS